MKVIYLEWTDACGQDGWHPIGAKDYTPETIKTIGFLLLEDKEKVVVTHSLSDAYHNAYIIIPKGWITKRKIIKL
jgi:hypothetical protein